MNWTGGRLQRSKAHENPSIKTQKQHFAKARLRRQNGHTRSPLSFSFTHGRNDGDGEDDDAAMPDEALTEAFSGQHERPLSRKLYEDMQANSLRNLQSQHHRGTSVERRPKRLRSNILLKHNAAATSSKLTHPSEPPHRETIQRKTSLAEHNRNSAATEINTLENVRRELLKRSDWMGISAARPLKMAFNSAEELENIGKRRGTPTKDGQKKKAAYANLTFLPDTEHCTHLPEGMRQTSMQETDDASVRIGVNIHRSQTTPRRSDKERQTIEIAPSLSTDSMLSIRFEHPTRGTDDQVCTRRTCSPASNSSSTTSDAHSPNHTGALLLSLDQVRDYKSFDEIKAKSAPRLSERVNFLPPPPRGSATQKAVSQAFDLKDDDSSSVVSGCRILSSPAGHCPTSVHVETAYFAMAGNETTDRMQAAKEAPAELSSGFWSGGSPQPLLKTNFEPLKFNAFHSSQNGSPIVQNVELRLTRPETMGAINPAPRLRDASELRQSCRQSFALEQHVMEEWPTRSQQRSDGGSPRNTRSPQSLSMSVADHERSDVLSRKVKPSDHKVDGRQGPGTQMEDEVMRGWKNALYADFTDRYPSLPQVDTPSLANKPLATTLDLPTSIQHMLWPQFSISGSQRRRLTGDNNQNIGAQNRRNQDILGKAKQEDTCGPWGKHVSKGSEGETNGFEFELSNKRLKIGDGTLHGRNPFQYEKDRRFRNQAWKPHSTPVALRSSLGTTQTSANTVLFRPQEPSSSQAMSAAQPLGTDFLHPLTPMEVLLAERFADSSVYSNPARGTRNFIPSPSSNGRNSDLAAVNRSNGSTFTVAHSSNTTTPEETPKSSNMLAGTRSTHRRPLHAAVHVSLDRVQIPLWVVAGKWTRGAVPCTLPSTVSLTSSPAGGDCSTGKPLQTPRKTTNAFLVHQSPVNQRANLQVQNGDTWMPATSSQRGETVSLSHQDGTMRDAASTQRDVALRADPETDFKMPRHDVMSVVSQEIPVEVDDKYLFMDETIPHSLSPESFFTCGRSPADDIATSRPATVLTNLHTKLDPPFVFKRPQPSTGMGRSRPQQCHTFEPVAAMKRAPGVRITARKPFTFQRFDLSNRANFESARETDGIESVSDS